LRQWHARVAPSPVGISAARCVFFAPLYLSNECVNNCKYCGFSRDNPILRVTLTIEQVVREARHLVAQGFRNILLVAGEHPALSAMVI
jgi:2-iminoacetate synthase ThiH